MENKHEQLSLFSVGAIDLLLYKFYTKATGPDIKRGSGFLRAFYGIQIHLISYHITPYQKTRAFNAEHQHSRQPRRTLTSAAPPA